MADYNYNDDDNNNKNDVDDDDDDNNCDNDDDYHDSDNSLLKLKHGDSRSLNFTSIFNDSSPVFAIIDNEEETKKNQFSVLFLRKIAMRTGLALLGCATQRTIKDPI